MTTSAEFHPYAASATIAALLTKDDYRSANSLLDGCDHTQLREVALASLRLLIRVQRAFGPQEEQWLLHFPEGHERYVQALSSTIIDLSWRSADLEMRRQGLTPDETGDGLDLAERAAEAFGNLANHQPTQHGHDEDSNSLGEN